MGKLVHTPARGGARSGRKKSTSHTACKVLHRENQSALGSRSAKSRLGPAIEWGGLGAGPADNVALHVGLVANARTHAAMLKSMACNSWCLAAGRAGTRRGEQGTMQRQPITGHDLRCAILAQKLWGIFSPNGEKQFLVTQTLPHRASA